jgi:carbonic anhydrase/acetyltransferase-like protein (isoleucine patch superfamily)
MEPEIHETCYVHESCVIIGNVKVHEKCGLWPNAVLRGDENSIEIGAGSNVQDCCVFHVSEGFPTKVGRNVSVGHGCVIHGATIEDDVIVGMNATVMNGAVVGRGSVVGAGALVKEGMRTKPGSLVVGLPARVLKEGDPTLREMALRNAQTYQDLAQRHRKGEFIQYMTRR